MLLLNMLSKAHDEMPL